MSDHLSGTDSTSAQTPKPRLRTVDRQQLLPDMPLEDLLDTDHQARVVWDFVSQLDLSLLYARVRAVEGGPGRPAIDPRILTAFWLYATLEGIGSARAWPGCATTTTPSGGWPEGSQSILTPCPISASPRGTSSTEC